jgi:5-methylcytosine-specific restriction endonuclease McrA
MNKPLANDIITYREMCDREGVQILQRGMNFHLRAGVSVVLMSRRHNAPYPDRVEDGGRVIIYEGHDSPRSVEVPDPKSVNQPERNESGSLTQNGLFHAAAQCCKGDRNHEEHVRVYEKIMNGVWAYNGAFILADSWMEARRGRKIFKFRLEIAEEPDTRHAEPHTLEHIRVIPSSVKAEVWRRDRGRCVKCGRTDNLHFDHIIPYSKGGTSLDASNIQLLCARHNIAKRDKIE